jgi:hypothetical protein
MKCLEKFKILLLLYELTHLLFPISQCFVLTTLDGVVVVVFFFYTKLFLNGHKQLCIYQQIFRFIRFNELDKLCLKSNKLPEITIYETKKVKTQFVWTINGTMNWSLNVFFSLLLLLLLFLFLFRLIWIIKNREKIIS